MRRAEPGGFTLLEALIAVGIAAVAVTTLMRLYGGSAEAGARAALTLAAVEIAEERLARLALAPVLSEGRIGPVDEGGLVWQAEVLRLGPAIEGRALFELRLGVSVPGGGPPVVKVATLRYAPVGPGTAGAAR